MKPGQPVQEKPIVEVTQEDVTIDATTAGYTG